MECNYNKNMAGFFKDIQQLNIKFMWKDKGTRIAQSTWKRVKLEEPLSRFTSKATLTKAL
jgi:hypothetical protein